MNKEFLYQNKKIFYRISGSGFPVVLVHGFGEDGEVWKNQIEFLVKLHEEKLPFSKRNFGIVKKITELSVNRNGVLVKNEINYFDIDYSNMMPILDVQKAFKKSKSKRF